MWNNIGYEQAPIPEFLGKVIDEAEKIFSAIPTEEPDRSKIKWRKYKFQYRKQQRDPKYQSMARRCLKINCRNLSQCEICGSTYKIQIHHKNRNFRDNNIENLQILCRSCHYQIHFPDEEGIIQER